MLNAAERLKSTVTLNLKRYEVRKHFASFFGAPPFLMCCILSLPPSAMACPVIIFKALRVSIFLRLGSCIGRIMGQQHRDVSLRHLHDQHFHHCEDEECEEQGHIALLLGMVNHWWPRLRELQKKRPKHG